MSRLNYYHCIDITMLVTKAFLGICYSSLKHFLPDVDVIPYFRSALCNGSGSINCRKI